MQRWLSLMLSWPLSQSAWAADIPQNVLDELQKSGTTRVIINLDVPWQPEGRLTAEAIVAQRSAIEQGETQFVEKVNQDLANAGIIDSVYSVDGQATLPAKVKFQTTPQLVMEVNTITLPLIAKNAAQIQFDTLDEPQLAESIPLIGADKAQAQGYTAKGQIIAVLDTGVDKTHPFFATNRVVAEACFSATLCPNGQPTDTSPNSALPCTFDSQHCDHGSHVAGIAASVAKDAQIIPVQVFSNFSGVARSASSDQIAALEWLYLTYGKADTSLAAVNMSLGGGQFATACDSDPRTMIIQNLKSVGVPTIVASGNNGYSDAIGAPACISAAVSVGATDKSDNVASFSNSASILNLLAPGAGIVSALPGGGTGAASGTSQAAPHVAGAWAVLKAAKPTATVDEVLTTLQSTGKAVTGKGVTKPRIQLDAALSLPPPSCTPGNLNPSYSGLPGALDPTFNSCGTTPGIVTTPVAGGIIITDMAIQPDGKIVTMGSNVSNGTTLVRYNPDGSLDANFNSTGIVITPDVSGRGLTLQPDGKIVVAGYVPKGGYYDFAVVRYNPNGGLDTTFNGTGKVTTHIRTNFAGSWGDWEDYGEDVVVQPDGKIVVIGSSNVSPGIAYGEITVVRYHSDGSLDTTFNNTGKVMLDSGGVGQQIATAVVLQPDGKIVVAGQNSLSFIVTRYNPNGDLDTTFNGTGKVTLPINGFAYDMALQSDGKIVLVGEEDFQGLVVLRCNLDGSLDTTFARITDGVRDGTSVVVQPDGKIVVTGRVKLANTQTKPIFSFGFSLIRYNSDGSLDMTFNNTGKVDTSVNKGSTYGGLAVALQADGKIVVAGESYNGESKDFTVARYISGTTELPPKDYKFTLNISGDGVVTGQGIDCGNDCTENFAPNTQLTLKATATAKSTFKGWEGDCIGNDATITITMDKAKSCTATFSPMCSEWNPAKDFRMSPGHENPNRDSCGNKDVWHFLQSADFNRDPQKYSLMQNFTTDYYGNSGLHGWGGTDRGEAYVDGNHFIPGVFAYMGDKVNVHPSWTKLAVVGWRSPISGNVAVTGSITDLDNLCGDGVLWYIDKDNTDLASGSLNNGAFQDVQSGAVSNSLSNIPVKQGEFIYFAVHPNTSHVCDSTILDVKISQVATVEPAKVTLTVTKTGTGDGQVTGQGINCGTDCTEDFAPNTPVTLTATANPSSIFKQWTGDCTGTNTTVTDATITFEIDKAKSCSATFETKPVGTPGLLTVQNTGTGSGRIIATMPTSTLVCDYSCDKTSYQYPAGATVKIKAIVYNSGTQFTGWSGDCSGTTQTATMTLDQAKNCVATFTLLPENQLPVDIFNIRFDKSGSGAGTIRSNQGTINCGSKCEGNYKQSINNLVVTATPGPFSTFAGWGSDCGVKNPAQPKSGIPVDRHRVCTAEFKSNTEVAANQLVEILYQDPVIETQYPRALNEACFNEAFWLATVPMTFVNTHLKIVGDWPIQFNGLNWYNKSPVGTCTQSVKVNSDTHGDYIEVKLNLQTAVGTIESTGLIISVDNSVNTGSWSYNPIYFPWIQM